MKVIKNKIRMKMRINVRKSNFLMTVNIGNVWIKLKPRVLLLILIHMLQISKLFQGCKSISREI
jgi:hypothetical protein